MGIRNSAKILGSDASIKYALHCSGIVNLFFHTPPNALALVKASSGKKFIRLPQQLSPALAGHIPEMRNFINCSYFRSTLQ